LVGVLDPVGMAFVVVGLLLADVQAAAITAKAARDATTHGRRDGILR